MTVDTSREAVEALIAELGDQSVEDDLSYRAGSALAALLDERDDARNASVWRDTIDEQRAYIRDLEADLNIERKRRKNVKIDRVIQRAERAEAERDKLAAKLDRMKQALPIGLINRLDEYGAIPLRHIVRKLRAILADTDEGNEK